MLKLVPTAVNAKPTRVVAVAFVWPCYNCGTPTPVDPPVHQMLRSGQLTGIDCGSCLQPPTAGILMRPAA